MPISTISQRDSFLPTSDEPSAAAWLASIVEHSEDAILSKTMDGIITTWNPAASRMFGYSVEEAVGNSISILIPKDMLDEEYEIISRVRAGERVDHFETVRRRKDGSLIEISLGVSPVRNAAGKIMGASKIARDVSAKVAFAAMEKERAEARLRELQTELFRVCRHTALGDMASALAHELNQPLTAITNFMAGSMILLKRDIVPLGRLGGAIEQAAKETARAAEIIRRFRDFVTGGEADLRPENLVSLVDEARAIALVGTSESGIRVRSEISAEVGAVLVDKVQIQQVVVNLIRNAVDAMAQSEQREILVRAEPTEDGMVLVTIADTGPGISAVVADSLFQSFVTTKRSGMGVGLSISRKIIDAHGGRIWACSNSGTGALISFTVPHYRTADEKNAG